MNGLAAYDITENDVRWMQERYLADFGQELDAEVAFHKLQLLVRQMDLLYRPVTKGQTMSVNENGDVSKWADKNKT